MTKNSRKQAQQKNILSTNLWTVVWMVFVFVCFLVIGVGRAEAATYYLDGDLGENCIGNYSIMNRTCTGLDGNAYNTIQGALSSLTSQDTLYVRAGSYYLAGTNEYTAGFNIANSKSGTSNAHTKISTYNSESVYIGSAADRMSLPSICHATNYYSYPAVTIKANYIDFIGFTLYGGLLVIGGDEPGAYVHDILIDRCDIGGGVPYNDQSFTVEFHDVYNATMQNCKVHHSGLSDSVGGAPGFGGYNMYAFTIKNCEFYDNCRGDLCVKDLSGGAGTTIDISYNLFLPSSYGANSGVDGITQDNTIYRVLVHNNIFYNKIDAGFQPYNLNPFIGYYELYNNTFINCGKDVNFWATGSNTNIRNNIFYHTSGSYYYDLYTGNTLNSDYNMFYSSGVSPHWHNGSTDVTSFSSWQGAGNDANSVNEVNPDFVNPTGSAAADFKRTSYPNDVAAGSSYGRVCGAYVTGNEVIGISGDTQLDEISPSVPRGLVVL